MGMEVRGPETSQEAQLQDPFSLSTQCVTLGKSFHLFEGWLTEPLLEWFRYVLICYGTLSQDPPPALAF